MEGVVSNEGYVLHLSLVLSVTLSTGCIKGIVPHLPELVPFLINCLADSRVRGRQLSH